MSDDFSPENKKEKQRKKQMYSKDKHLNIQLFAKCYVSIVSPIWSLHLHIRHVTYAKNNHNIVQCSMIQVIHSFLHSSLIWCS